MTRTEIIAKHLDALNAELHSNGHRIVALVPSFLAQSAFDTLREQLTPTPTKITVITLYRDKSCETYVGAVKGAITPKEAQEIAKRANLAYEEDEEEDTIGFQEVEIAEDALSFGNLRQAFPEDPLWVFTGREL